MIFQEEKNGSTANDWKLEAIRFFPEVLPQKTPQ